MPPRIYLSPLLLALTCAASSCAAGGITRAEADALRAELETLRAENEALAQRLAVLESGDPSMATPTTPPTTDAERLRERKLQLEQEAERERQRRAEGDARAAEHEAAEAARWAREPRDEPWATDTEAWLRDQFAASFENPPEQYAMELEHMGVDCTALSGNLDVECRSLRCVMQWVPDSGKRPEVELCFASAMEFGLDQISGSPPSPAVPSRGWGMAEGFGQEYFRRDHDRSEVYTVGLEDALAAEPRDDTWADEAEALLRTAASLTDRHGIYDAEVCGEPVAVDCRTVTCRVTFEPTQPGADCDHGVRQAWSMSEIGSLPSPDPTRRTWVLPREGHLIEDVEDL